MYNRHIYNGYIKKEASMKKLPKILLITVLVLVIAAALYLLYLLIFVVLPMVPTFLEALLKSL